MLLTSYNADISKNDSTDIFKKIWQSILVRFWNKYVFFDPSLGSDYFINVLRKNATPSSSLDNVT